MPGAGVCAATGDYRVPNVGRLDIGTGEYSPGPKCFSDGWSAHAPAQAAEPKRAKPAVSDI